MDLMWRHIDLIWRKHGFNVDKYGFMMDRIWIKCGEMLFNMEKIWI